MIDFAIASFDPVNGYPPEVGTVLRWVPAVIVAVALIWCGVRPLSRLVWWAAGLLALWAVPAVFTGPGVSDRAGDGVAAGGGGAGDCGGGDCGAMEDHCLPGR